MKKKYSIAIMCLVLYLSVINIKPAYAKNLDYNNIQSNVNQEINYSNLNLKYNNSNTEEDVDVLQVFNHENQKVYITEYDINLMAKLVSAESIGEPYEGKVAVASVVLNRTIDPHFPNTIKDVIFQRNAFSCVRSGSINAIANEDCYNAVYDAIKGNDPSNDALFFYNPRISTCNWMKQSVKVNKKVIGNHTFFKVVA